MFDTILIPLDGSELSERALEPALALARWPHARILLLHVATFPQLLLSSGRGEGEVWEEDLKDHVRLEAEDYLRSVEQRFPDYNIDICVGEGDEAGAIVDLAAQEKVGLIVMTTHGRSGISRWLLGSVTERVLQQAPCPVLVIREERPIRRVLITLDGSACSEQALIPGHELATRLGAELTLLRVFPGDTLRKDEHEQLEWVEAGLTRRMVGTVRQHLHNYLVEQAKKVARPGQHIDTVVLEGSPAATILDFATVQDFDLIVMATHGHSGLQRWIYGSVTNRVMRHAPCHMMIVRPRIIKQAKAEEEVSADRVLTAF